MNFINEPRLFITFNTGTGDYAYTLLTNDRNGLVTDVVKNGGSADANIPTKQYAGYIQDDWQVSPKLTLNLGFRYDLLTGFAIDQTKNPNFVKLQNAAVAGRFAGQPAFQDFGKSSEEDKNNFQPRAGAVYDMRGDGRDVLRAGWGRYYDVGYTNANILFAAVNATGIGAGKIFNVNNPNGIIKNNGQLLPRRRRSSDDRERRTRPAARCRSTRTSRRRGSLSPTPTRRQLAGRTSSMPRPCSTSTTSTPTGTISAGASSSISVNPAGATDRGSSPISAVSPANFTIDISNGRSTYRRRQLRRPPPDDAAGCSSRRGTRCRSAKSTTGNGADELNVQNIQNHLDPFADVQYGPSGRTDARHRVDGLGGRGGAVGHHGRAGLALPLGAAGRITQGIDLNGNGANNDIPDEAFGSTG